ncbi:CGR1 [Candida pseudojiufengensis]|uniref:CGR1 n=1 Tax=Candida pseudojiufengensis TaxID=497109 RepID=UPI002224439E|nr:CGR1 [Candida pseudojiufengensis]KAI5965713.1 CGR1 [Candida pseudojiufengensis]
MSIEVSKEDIFPQDYRGRLTEGVTYDYRNNQLIWIDIILGEIHRVSLTDLNKHEILKWENPKESVGFIGLTSNEDIVLVAAKSGLAYGNFKTKKLEYFFKYPFTDSEKDRLRSNDGIIDPWGNLWIGVMNDFHVEEVKEEGYLYRITPDLQIDVMLTNTKISNGLAFNNEGNELYWTDSQNYTIFKFKYDKDSNKLSDKQAFVETKQLYPDIESPEPDGMIRTENGDIYSAIFNTGTILHVNSKGELIDKIHVPAKRCTCVTIGGLDDNELFINTGNLKLDDFNHSINVDDLFGDLGGFLFRLKLKNKLYGQKKNIWGGKVE